MGCGASAQSSAHDPRGKEGKTSEDDFEDPNNSVDSRGDQNRSREDGGKESTLSNFLYTMSRLKDSGLNYVLNRDSQKLLKDENPKSNHDRKTNGILTKDTKRTMRKEKLVRSFRMMVCNPFRRTSPLSDLLVKCCFPALRDFARSFGFSLLIINATPEADLLDNHVNLRRRVIVENEFHLCLQSSPDFALLSLLDHSIKLYQPLPPWQISESDFFAFLDKAKQVDGDSDASFSDESQLLYSSDDNNARIKVADVLKQWYRQSEKLSGLPFFFTLPSHDEMFRLEKSRSGLMPTFQTDDHLQMAKELSILSQFFSEHDVVLLPSEETLSASNLQDVSDVKVEDEMSLLKFDRDLSLSQLEASNDILDLQPQESVNEWSKPTSIEKELSRSKESVSEVRGASALATSSRPSPYMYASNGQKEILYKYESSLFEQLFSSAPPRLVFQHPQGLVTLPAGMQFQYQDLFEERERLDWKVVSLVGGKGQKSGGETSSRARGDQLAGDDDQSRLPRDVRRMLNSLTPQRGETVDMLDASAASEEERPARLKAETLKLVFASLEVDGLHPAAFSLVITILKNGSEESRESRTSKKQAQNGGMLRWHAMSPLEIEVEMKESSIIYLKLFEHRRLGEKLCATGSALLKDVAIELDEFSRETWRVIDLVLNDHNSSAKRMSVRLQLLFQPESSGMSRARRGYELLNAHDYDGAWKMFDDAKTRFIKHRNVVMTVVCNEMLVEVDKRRSAYSPSIMRRVGCMGSLISKHTGGEEEEFATSWQLESEEFDALLEKVGSMKSSQVQGLRELLEESVMTSATSRKLKTNDFFTKSEVSALQHFMTHMKKQLFASMSAQLANEMQGNGENVGTDVQDEVTSHVRLQQSLVNQFDLLPHLEALKGDVLQYIFEDTATAAPLFLLQAAQPGVGLTTFTAFVASYVVEKYEKSEMKPIIISRYVGETFLSRSMETLIHSIFLQLQAEDLIYRQEANMKGLAAPLFLEKPKSWVRKLQKDYGVLSDFTELCFQFRTLLDSVSSRRPVIIFLDGMQDLQDLIFLLRYQVAAPKLDIRIASGLSSEPSSSSSVQVASYQQMQLESLFSWLPSSGLNPVGAFLPANIRIVISSSSLGPLDLFLQSQASRNTIRVVKGVSSADKVMLTSILRSMIAKHSEMVDDEVAEAHVKHVATFLNDIHHELLASHDGFVDLSFLAVKLRLQLLLGISMGRLMRRPGNSLARESILAVVSNLEEVERLQQCRSIDDVSLVLFEMAGHCYGEGLLRRLLSLLCATTYGMTEDELVDVLATPERHIKGAQNDSMAQDAILSQVKMMRERAKVDKLGWENVSGTAAKVSHLDVLALIQMLGPVLKERTHYSARLLVFSSQKVLEVAKKYCFSRGAAREHTHMLLAAYFSGSQSGHDWHRIQDEDLRVQMAEACRRHLSRSTSFPAQPWFWEVAMQEVTSEEKPGEQVGRQTRVFNLRKMHEFVPQLISAGLFEAASVCLTDLQYITDKFEAGLSFQLLQEFVLLRSAKSSAQTKSYFHDDCSQMEEFLMRNYNLLIRQPMMIYQSAANSLSNGPFRSYLRHLQTKNAKPPWLKGIRLGHENSLQNLWTLQWHKEPIVSMCLSADGSRLATSCMQKQICLWSVGDGVLVHAFQHNRSRISVMCFSDPPHQLAVGDADGGVRILSIRGQTKVNVTEDFGLLAHKAIVKSLSFLGHLKILLSAASDGEMKLWSTASLTNLRTIQLHKLPLHQLQLLTYHSVNSPKDSSKEPQSVAPAKSDLGISGNFHVWSCSDDCSVKEWNLQTCNCLKTFEGHNSAVITIRVNLQLDMLASGSRDETCRLWSISKNTLIGVIRHFVPISHVDLDDSAEVVLTVCKNGFLRVWDLNTLNQLSETDIASAPAGNRSGTNRQGVICLLDPHTGNFLSAAAEQVRAVSTRFSSFSVNRMIEPPQEEETFFSSHAVKLLEEQGLLSFSSSYRDSLLKVVAMDDLLITYGGLKQVSIWNAKTGDLLRRLDNEEHRIAGLDFSPEYRWLLAAACSDGQVLFWDTRSKASNHVKLFFIHPAHFRQITTISFSPRERTFLTASVDKCVRLWSFSLEKNDNSNSLLQESRGPTVGSGLTSASESLRVVMKFVLAGHTEAVSHASFSPDGKLIASCSWDGSAILWDAINGSQRFLLRPVGLPRAFLCTCWAEDGSLMAAGTEDASIYVWRSKDSREVRRFRSSAAADVPSHITLESLLSNPLKSLHAPLGHSDSITSVRFCKKGKVILSSSMDGTVKLWSLEQGQFIRNILRCPSKTNVMSMGLTKDGAEVFAGCSDGHVRFTKMPRVTEAAARNSAQENGKLDRKRSSRRSSPQASSKSEKAKLQDDWIFFEEERKPKFDPSLDCLQACIEYNPAFEKGGAKACISFVGLDHLTYIACEGSKEIEVRDPKNNYQLMSKMEGHSDEVTSLSLDLESHKLLSSSKDGSITLWDTHSGDAVFSLPCCRQGLSEASMDFSLELAVTGSFIGDVQSINLRSQQFIKQFSDSDAPVVRAEYINDGRLLAYGYQNGLMCLRDYRQSDKVVKIQATGDAREHRRLPKYKPQDLKKLFTSIEGLIKSSPEKSQAETPKMHGMRCTADGRLLVCAYDQTVQVWDTRQTKESLITDSSHTSTVTALSLLDNDDLVVSGGDDCLLKIWSIRGKPMTETPDAHLVASIDHLKSVRMVNEFTWSYGERLFRVPSPFVSVSYHCNQSVRCIGGKTSNLFLIATSDGVLHPFSLVRGNKSQH